MLHIRTARSLEHGRRLALVCMVIPLLFLLVLVHALPGPNLTHSFTPSSAFRHPPGLGPSTLGARAAFAASCPLLIPSHDTSSLSLALRCSIFFLAPPLPALQSRRSFLIPSGFFAARQSQPVSSRFASRPRGHDDHLTPCRSLTLRQKPLLPPPAPLLL